MADDMAASKSCWEEAVEKFFATNLRPYHKFALEHLLKAEDVFVSVYEDDKSLCYEAFPVAAAAATRGQPVFLFCRNYQRNYELCSEQIVIVVTALKSKMIEQCERLRSLGFTAVILDDVGKNDKSLEKELFNGKIQFIFTSPEVIVDSDRWLIKMLRNKTYSEKSRNLAGLIVVDEAQIVTQW